MKELVPLRRLGTESEVSAAIVFLLSPAAAFISGACLRVDGAAPNAKRIWPEVGTGGSTPAFDGFHLAATPNVLKRASEAAPMPALTSLLDATTRPAPRDRAHALALVDRWRALEARTRAASAQAAPLFAKRGQLLPRERVARLLDPGVPFLELSTLAGWLLDSDDADRSVPGGGVDRRHRRRLGVFA